MEIIQVIIFIIIIFVAVVQQLSKTDKEKTTPSPKDVLADMFPEIETEEESVGEEPIAAPAPTVRKPKPVRRQYRPTQQPAASSPQPNSAKPQNRREGQTPVRLSTREEARRAFIYSEIFNRKY